MDKNQPKSQKQIALESQKTSPVKKAQTKEMEEPEEEIIGKHFKVIQRLNGGAFGDIYLGVNKLNNMEVAIKVEKTPEKSHQLFYEAKLYDLLKKSIYRHRIPVPAIYYAAKENNMNVMVMELLGPSLDQLMTHCGGRFSMKTTILLAREMISQLEFLHKHCFIHRDLKPGNFLVGRGENYSNIYMIDYGLSKKFMIRNEHIPYKEGKKLTGTPVFATLNQHLGIEYSRRDDLCALGFMLVYFLKGTLPWLHLKGSTKKDHFQKILEKKAKITVESLCKGLPPEFGHFINYCKKLRFDEEPNYKMLQKMFGSLFERLRYRNDDEYDWIAMERKEIEEKEAVIRRQREEQVRLEMEQVRSEMEQVEECKR